MGGEGRHGLRAPISPRKQARPLVSLCILAPRGKLGSNILRAQLGGHVCAHGQVTSISGLRALTTLSLVRGLSCSFQGCTILWGVGLGSPLRARSTSGVQHLVWGWAAGGQEAQAGSRRLGCPRWAESDHGAPRLSAPRTPHWLNARVKHTAEWTLGLHGSQ